MTITEARDALYAQYTQGKKVPLPVVGVTAGDFLERPVLRVFVSRFAPLYVPEESKPGVGFQGFECVSFQGVATLVSDSGVIP